MNNKYPLPKKTDKQKPLVPLITITNQNCILLKPGPSTNINTASNEDNIFDWSTPWSKKTDKRKNKPNSQTGTSPKLKHSNSKYTSKNRFSPLATAYK